MFIKLRPIERNFCRISIYLRIHFAKCFPKVFAIPRYLLRGPVPSMYNDRWLPNVLSLLVYHFYHLDSMYMIISVCPLHVQNIQLISLFNCCKINKHRFNQSIVKLAKLLNL
nr:MAG TPA: hypothetical protein [Caudoviricetes sp.]